MSKFYNNRTENVADLRILEHSAGGRHALLRHGRRNHLLPSSGRPSMRQRGVVRHGRRSRSRHRGSERSHIYNLGWFGTKVWLSILLNSRAPTLSFGCQSACRTRAVRWCAWCGWASAAGRRSRPRAVAGSGTCEGKLWHLVNSVSSVGKVVDFFFQVSNVGIIQVMWNKVEK